jgi:hypothetical protein
MKAHEAQSLYRDLLGIWPRPEPEESEQRQWGKALLSEDNVVAARTLTYLEQQLVQGEPQAFRPTLPQWLHRYRLLDKARKGVVRREHDACTAGLVWIPDEHYHEDCPCKEGVWRPCEQCNPEGYEKWRSGELYLQPKETERHLHAVA